MPHVVRAFVKLRELLASNKELARRLDELEARIEKKLATHDQAIAAILSANPSAYEPAAIQAPPDRIHCRPQQEELRYQPAAPVAQWATKLPPRLSCIGLSAASDCASTAASSGGLLRPVLQRQSPHRQAIPRCSPASTTPITMT
jgi:cell division septum initiation protein DivIVA